MAGIEARRRRSSGSCRTSLKAWFRGPRLSDTATRSFRRAATDDRNSEISGWRDADILAVVGSKGPANVRVLVHHAECHWHRSA